MSSAPPFVCDIFHPRENHRQRAILNPEHIVSIAETGTAVMVTTSDGGRLTVCMEFDRIAELVLPREPLVLPGDSLETPL